MLKQLFRPRGGRGPFAPILDYGENVLWHERELEPRVASALEELTWAEPFESQAMLDVLEPDLDAFLRPVSNPLAREFLEQDIASLARSLGAAMGRRHLHGQLAIMARDGCRKFHADNVSLRLLCTYVGPGTEWIPNENVERRNLARTDVDFETANRSVLRRPDGVRRCGAGDILILKGEAFDRNRGSGAVHRSPPIVEHELRRLVFKLDESPCGC